MRYLKMAECFVGETMQRVDRVDNLEEFGEDPICLLGTFVLIV